MLYKDNSFFLVLINLFFAFVFSDETQLIPNSCIDLEDGEQFIKMLDGDNYPVVKVKCSNGYTILDYNLDSEISSYFTSFLKWHYSLAGPSQSQHINLEEWYVPDDGSTKYLVSDDCSSCDESIQEYSTKNGYYMNANIYGCFVFPRGMADCDFDLDTLECHACYATTDFSTIYQTEFGAEDALYMGSCMTFVRESNAEVDRTFDECTSQTDTGYKPTIGVEGKYCICVQPSTTQYFSIDSTAISTKEAKLATAAAEALTEEAEVEAKQELGWNYQTKYLYAADFAPGTYRIKEPGTYILMEDIEFDWNAGDINDNPNGDGGWWPSEDDESYPGWGTTRDEYFMGYFAGITIESDNVVIDLNGHKLQQSKAFFYQQGFFSDIEVQSQPFIPSQGVGFFGSDPQFPENVVIKNGYLGRTSHHCIHGNYNKNLLIEDIVCSDFSTHGIQLNGFDGATLRNVEVGPSNNEQYLASEYTHYRFVLERLRTIIEEENPTETIKFADRAPVTLNQLHEKLQTEMNYAFKYVMLGEEGDENDELWMEAKNTFLSSTGYGYGASVYGIFLSYPGANVLTYHANHKLSNNAILENVYIHDISHKTKEYVGLRTHARMFVNSFNAPLHLQYLIGNDIFQSYLEQGGQQTFDNSMRYVGNILTDVTIAIHELSQNWGKLQIMYLLTDELVAWATGEDSMTALGNAKKHDIEYWCGVDGMIHSAKGAFGLRIDGADSISIDTLLIENIVEYGDLGYEMCGECLKCAFEARTPYQMGYAGNMAQGISVDYTTNLNAKNIVIRNVESKTGRSIGFSIWPGTTVNMEGTILVEDINAGADVEKGSLTSSDLPNAAPEACAIRVYNSDVYDESHNDNDISIVSLSDDVVITSACVSGHATCWDQNINTQLGDYLDCNEKSNINTEMKTLTIDVPSHIHTTYRNNLTPYSFYTSLPIIFVIFVVVIITSYNIIRFIQNKKASSMKVESEKTPLLQYE